MYTKINYIIKFGKILKLLFLAISLYATYCTVVIYLEKKKLIYTTYVMHLPCTSYNKNLKTKYKT